MVLPRLAPLLYANSFNEKKLKREAVSAVRWGVKNIYIYMEIFQSSRLPCDKFHPKSNVDVEIFLSAY